MYPLYWTSSKEGIFMRYSYEYKIKCIEQYRKGIFEKTPEGVSTRSFRQNIREWSRIEEAKGSEALKHKSQNKKWKADEKMELVLQVLEGNSIKGVAIKAGINDGMLYQWFRKYNDLGYNGLIEQKRGRPMKESKMKKEKKNTNESRKLDESEYEELIRLREENEYIKTENAVIKKLIALRREKQVAQLKAKKQQLSKSSEKKVIN